MISFASAEIKKVDPDHVIMTTSDYKELLSAAREGKVREDDDKKPDTGKIFVGAGLGYNSVMVFGGFVFP